MTKLRAGTIQQWFADFVDALQQTRTDKGTAEPPLTEPSPLWTLHSVKSGARYH